ncbi:recombinase RecB [Saccharomonospora sp. CUA-673]|uniref:RecB family exonuclease n=1 Tax=Saccharomonospora sp. CUA-673 TaxID=1904969 RepID=UPI00095CCB48|nr:RecB family exonuclease [Saccharomonospora sp. CUA-673]OLT46724.1 recombinase RecB [Saccharomonospora sp. CUA-673]
MSENGTPTGDPATDTETGAATDTATDTARPRRRPALSPSRAGDFKQCPLLYRFRSVDRLPEPPTQAQVRGTLVHSVLERLFAVPRGDRTPERASALLAPTWEELAADNPEWTDLFADGTDGDGATDTAAEPNGSPAAAAPAGWLEGAQKLLDAYFDLEDPNRLEPEACEVHVETELSSGVLLRGYVDRLDVAPTGEIRVVDYKTGAAPRAIGEAKAMFQMKFYAVVLWRTRGVVPRQLKLMYLRDGQALAYTPDEAELARFERTLEAIWSAILKAGRTGDFRPSPSKLCDWCAHQALCPSFGGTPPEYPGWPEPDPGEESALDRAD